MPNSPVFVGDCNTKSLDPKLALHPLPVVSPGNRLRQILGLSFLSYIRLDRRNLCNGSWSNAEARKVAYEIVDEEHALVVLLGKRVGNVFGFVGVPYTVNNRGKSVYLLLPEPTSAILENERQRVRFALFHYCKDVPWGEVDGKTIS